MADPSEPRFGERSNTTPDYQPVQTAETSPGVSFPGGEPQPSGDGRVSGQSGAYEEAQSGPSQGAQSGAAEGAQSGAAEEFRQQSGQAADQASQAADEARHRATETARAVREQAGETAELLRSQAAAKADEARQQGYAIANDRKNRVAETVEDVSQALRRAAQRLSEENDPGLAGAAQRLADRVEGVGRHLHDQDAKELYHEAEEFVRRHPAAVMGGMFCVGWAAARFLKSQPPRRAGRPADASSNAPSLAARQ